MLYASQIRAARALLGWRQDDLAKGAGVGMATVQRLEKAQGIAIGNYATVLRIQAALEQAGIRFIEDDDSGGIGVRLQKQHTSR
jgi:transcriptional regulator with XRE-family HTH domain